MSQLCSICHTFPVTLHSLGAYGQGSVSNHIGGKWSGVLWTKSWYGQFEVRWLQPLQLWFSVGISSVALVLVSRDRDLCHAQPHPTWSEPAAGYSVDQWFQICRVGTHQRVYAMVKGLFRQLVNFFISLYAAMAWYPAETNMSAFVTEQPEEAHDMANKRVLSVFTLNRL